jgi:hypothetical protein
MEDVVWDTEGEWMIEFWSRGNDGWNDTKYICIHWMALGVLLGKYQVALDRLFTNER